MYLSNNRFALSTPQGARAAQAHAQRSARHASEVGWVPNYPSDYSGAPDREQSQLQQKQPKSYQVMGQKST